jgi:multiple sugar transport system substrate-binding protein
MGKRHWLTLIVVLSLSVLVLASAASAKVKLQFMGWEASPLETQSVMEGLELFMKENPDIEVEYIAGRWAEHHTKLLTMMAGGAAPDVFFLGAEPYYRDFQKRGVLYDMTSLFDSELHLDEFIPLDQEKMLINGHIYGISSCIVAPVLYYNMNMFDDAGVPYPPHNPDKAWTWDEFVSVAKKLTLEKGGKTTQFGAYGFEGYWWPMIWSNQGELFTEDYSRCVLADDANAKEALQKTLDLRTVHGASPDASYMENIGMSAAQMLQTGRVAMLMDGSWALQELSQMDFPVGVAPLPVFKVPATSGTAHLHAIWKGTKHPEAAWRLVKFLSSKEYQIDLVRSGLWMPNRTEMYSDSGIKEWLDPVVHPPGFEEVIPFFTKYARPHPAIMVPKEAWDILTEELDYFWHDGQDLNQVLDRLTTRVNSVLSAEAK